MIDHTITVPDRFADYSTIMIGLEPNRTRTGVAAWIVERGVIEERTDRASTKRIALQFFPDGSTPAEGYRDLASRAAA